MRKMKAFKKKTNLREKNFHIEKIPKGKLQARRMQGKNVSLGSPRKMMIKRNFSIMRFLKGGSGARVSISVNTRGVNKANLTKERGVTEIKLKSLDRAKRNQQRS
jgi:hypothetical protein